MIAKSVLFVDDDPRSCPDAKLQRHLSKRYGLQAIVAGPLHPIESAVEAAKAHPEIAGVVVDACGQTDYQHVARLRELLPHVVIAVHSGGMTKATRDLALAAGADVCIPKGDELTIFYTRISDDYRAAMRRFYFDLPTLLQDTSKVGRWVGYSRQGRIAEGDNEVDVLRQCQQQLQNKQFVVSRIMPDSVIDERSQGVRP